MDRKKIRKMIADLLQSAGIRFLHTDMSTPLPQKTKAGALH
jgi:hypothetical protein